MKQLYKIFIFTFVFSFVFGFTWALFIKPQQERKYDFQIQLLAPHLIEPIELKKVFSSDSKIEVEVITYNNFDELEKQLNSGSIDAVLIPSTVSARVIENKNLQPLTKPLRQFLSFIHIDFKGMRFDHENTFTLPLFWGVNGFAFKGQHNISDLTEQNNSSISYLDELFQVSTKRGENPLPPLQNIHTLSESSLMQAKSNQPIVQLPMSYFEKFNNLGSSDEKWTFELPDQQSSFWVLSAGLVNPKKSKALTAFIETLFASSFQEKYLAKNPLAATFLTTDQLPEAQQPHFLRSLPLHKLQMREIPMSELIDSKNENLEL